MRESIGAISARIEQRSRAAANRPAAINCPTSCSPDSIDDEDASGRIRRLLAQCIPLCRHRNCAVATECLDATGFVEDFEFHALTREQGRESAEFEPVRRYPYATAVSGNRIQFGCGQWALHDETRIPLLSLGVGKVVVNAVRIKRDGREAEQFHGIWYPAPVVRFLRSLHTLNCGDGLLRPTVDDGLALADPVASLLCHDAIHVDQNEVASLARFMSDVR